MVQLTTYLHIFSTLKIFELIFTDMFRVLYEAIQPKFIIILATAELNMKF